MVILDYYKKNHRQIIQACVQALKAGKVVVYPTDTSYGLAVDVNNIQAINRELYIYDTSRLEFILIFTGLEE